MTRSMNTLGTTLATKMELTGPHLPGKVPAISQNFATGLQLNTVPKVIPTSHATFRR